MAIIDDKSYYVVLNIHTIVAMPLIKPNKIGTYAGINDAPPVGIAIKNNAKSIETNPANIVLGNKSGICFAVVNSITPNRVNNPVIQ